MSLDKDRNKILQWLSTFSTTKNSSHKNPRSLTMSPKKHPFLNAYQYTAQVKLGNAIAGGTSLSFNQQDAFFGAVCEAVERLSLRDRRAGRSSNGIAIHTQKKEARSRAARELIERHLFLAHYWGRIPFYSPSKVIAESDLFTHAREALKKQKAELLLWEMRRINGFRSFVVVIYDARKRAEFGLALGCATKETEAKAAESALCEALHVFYWLRSERTKLNLKKFMKLEKPAPHHHALLGWSPDYLKETKVFFTKVNSRKNTPIKLDVRKFRYLELDLPEDIDCPFIVSKATHPDLLDMIFTHPTEDDETEALLKLKKFWKREFSSDSLPALPHPFP